MIGDKPLPEWLNRVLPASASESDATLLVIAAVLMVAIALLRQLQVLASSLLSAYTGEQLILGFRAQLFRHIQRLSLAYHDATQTADSIYRMQYDSPAIRYIAIEGIIPFITATVTLVSMVYITFRLDWQLALVAAAVSLVQCLTVQAVLARLAPVLVTASVS